MNSFISIKLRRLLPRISLFLALIAVLASLSCASENASAAGLIACVREHGVSEGDTYILKQECNVGTIKFRCTESGEIKLSFKDGTRTLSTVFYSCGIDRNTEWIFSNKRIRSGKPIVENVFFRISGETADVYKITVRSSGEDEPVPPGDKYDRIAADADNFKVDCFGAAEKYLSERFQIRFYELFSD